MALKPLRFDKSGLYQLSLYIPGLFLYALSGSEPLSALDNRKTKFPPVIFIPKVKKACYSFVILNCIKRGFGKQLFTVY